MAQSGGYNIGKSENPARFGNVSSFARKINVSSKKGPNAMPKPLPPVVSGNKTDLVNLFSHYLLNPKSFGYKTTDPITLNLIKDVLTHKSFGAAFTYEQRNFRMKPDDIGPALNGLAEDLLAYFSSSPLTKQDDYDAWIKKVGDKFLASCAPYRAFQFGKAQKIINVTMKHLYCYNVDESYFLFCHIALDSMTYTGRKSNALDGGFYECEVKHNAITQAFSNLYWDEYIEIQKDMRAYLAKPGHGYVDPSSGNLTPFKAEFYIWPRYKK